VRKNQGGDTGIGVTVQRRTHNIGLVTQLNFGQKKNKERGMRVVFLSKNEVERGIRKRKLIEGDGFPMPGGNRISGVVARIQGSGEAPEKGQRLEVQIMSVPWRAEKREKKKT